MPITSHKNMEFGDKQDTVKLITYHSSKGLEFPVVAMPGVCVPSDAESAEEEARLLYVAMTRATRELLVLEGAVGNPAHSGAE